jgi:proteasome alpha subunit
MLTPYDWQEGIGNRAQYIEGKLAQGTPVVAVSLQAGILVFTYRRQSRKVFEVYDRLIFGAIGLQSDVEALRMGAVEFAHQEGYNRSEEDVTIQRVATAISNAVKKAFSDFTVAPVVARSLFGEVGATVEADTYYVLDFDGDFQSSRKYAVVAGLEEFRDELAAALGSFDVKLSPEKATGELQTIFSNLKVGEESLDLEGLKPEAVLLRRSAEKEDRFEVLLREDL